MASTNPRLRLSLYLGLLALLSGILLFSHLGRDSMGGDESLYALCVENIRTTGQWVHITPRVGEAYFQKPPLQIWLTAATAGWFDPADFSRYRVWSAIFAFTSVLLVGWLGARLVAPEVGLLAGLIFLTNRKFLVDHGARSGAFDAGITFFFVCAGCLIWLILDRRRRIDPLDERARVRLRDEIVRFALVGVCAGLASLLKPFIGGLFLALGAIVLLLHPHRRTSFLGLLISLVSMLAVAVPWYAARYARFGPQLFEEMFSKNIVQRMTTGVDERHLQGPLFFIDSISRSTEAFNLALLIPAMLLIVVASFAGDRRSQFRLVSVLGLGWVAAFSLSSSKMGHYVYPAFPFVAIAVAELIRVIATWLTRPIKDLPTRHAAVLLLLAAVSAALTFVAGKRFTSDIPKAQRRYVPVQLYAELRSFLSDGSMRCVILGHPSQMGMRDLFHLKLIPDATWISDPGSLDAQRADGKPLLLITPLPASITLPAGAEILHTGEEKRADRVLVAILPPRGPSQ